MTKVKNEFSEKILIFEDDKLIKEAENILQQIFTEIEILKVKFEDLFLPFSKEFLLRSLKEGTEFLVDTLYMNLTSAYKGVAPSIIEDLMGDKERLRPHVKAIQEVCSNINNLCNQISLDPETLDIDSRGTPLLTNTLKEHLVEINRVYIETSEERELYSIFQQFIEISNKLEKSLKRYDYPLMFTDLFTFNPFNCYEINPDKYEETGVWELVLNPYVFSNLKNLKGAKSTPFLPGAAGLMNILNKNKTTKGELDSEKWQNKKDRWKNIPGV